MSLSAEIVVFAFSLLLAACAAGSQAPPSEPPLENIFTLVLGQGGGFTGAQEGIRLSSDGKLSRWQRFPGKPEVAHPIGTLSPQQLDQLKKVFTTLDFAKIPVGEPGNVYSFFEVTTSRGTQNFVWRGFYEDAPEALRALINVMLRVEEELTDHAPPRSSPHP